MVNILITILAAALLILLWVMLYDGNRFVVKRHVLCDARIRKDCRAVVLADLHNKVYGRDNQVLFDAIRAEKPDMILIAGDMLTAKAGVVFEPALHVLRELQKDYPIYYGNGNHEHRIKLYRENYGDMAQRYAEALEEIGVEPLVNAHIRLADCGITVYGAEIDKFYYKRFRVQPMEADYLTGILGKPDRGDYCVLLAHNPDYFPQYAEWGADLVISGHVHGGVVRVPILGKGVLSPNVRLFPRYDGGRYDEAGSVMLLSRGLGMHTIPFRLFNPGELLVVDFRAGNGGT